MKNFKATPDSDYDYQISQRTFTGRITKGRWKKLQRAARKFSNASLYGKSPNGYNYTCGCSYDCCGCLSSQSMQVSYQQNQVCITLSQSYNY